MKKNIYIIIIIILIICLDQIVKLKVFNQNYEMLGGILNISYVQNTGMAYGMGGNSTQVIIALNILIIVFLLGILILKHKNLKNIQKISLAVILSGGISNLIDRIFRGFVIDYINVTKILEFPIFNIADICVVLGTCILIISILSENIKQENKNETI